MNCDNVLSLLPDHLDGILDDKEKNNLKDHISNCKNCNDELKKLKTIISLVNNLPKLTIPTDIRQNVLKEIENRHIFKIMKVLQFAACLLLSFSLGIWLFKGQIKSNYEKKNVAVDHQNDFSKNELKKIILNRKKYLQNNEQRSLEKAKKVTKKKQSTDHDIISKDSNFENRELEIMKEAPFYDSDAKQTSLPKLNNAFGRSKNKERKASLKIEKEAIIDSNINNADIPNDEFRSNDLSKYDESDESDNSDKSYEVDESYRSEEIGKSYKNNEGYKSDKVNRDKMNVDGNFDKKNIAPKKTNRSEKEIHSVINKYLKNNQKHQKQSCVICHKKTSLQIVNMHTILLQKKRNTYEHANNCYMCHFIPQEKMTNHKFEAKKWDHFFQNKIFTAPLSNTEEIIKNIIFLEHAIKNLAFSKTENRYVGHIKQSISLYFTKLRINKSKTINSISEKLKQVELRINNRKELLKLAYFIKQKAEFLQKLANQQDNLMEEVIIQKNTNEADDNDR